MALFLDVLFFVVLFFVAVVVAMGAVLALPVMLLWNWLMPDLFGLPVIGYLQSWGLLLLSGFMFKSHSSGGGKS